MVAALKNGRNSVGVEIDPEYCRMIARYLKAESNDLFNEVELQFERTVHVKKQMVVREDKELYNVRPARKRLEELASKAIDSNKK